MIIDGKEIAGEVLRDIRSEIEALGRVVSVRAVVVRPTPATESYLKIKTAFAEEAGMRLEVVRLAEVTTNEEVIETVHAPGADAVIVQLPLPAEFDTSAIVNAIPSAQDADVLSDGAYAQFEHGEPGALIPPVAGAVLDILRRGNVEVLNKKVVVVGIGKLVGKPVAVLLKRLGANVSVIRRTTENKDTLFKEADIIVSGAGTPNFITPEMVKEGVVCIDAGTSGVGGGVAGDFDPACRLKASLFTPVPGGVGPIAVAYLFKNTSLLLETRR